jgi:excisionase family DNA binding protein
MSERFNSVEDVAEQLQVDKQTVRRWIKEGRLAAVKPGLEWRIRQSDLDEFLEARSYPKVPAPLSSVEEPETAQAERHALYLSTVLEDVRDLARQPRWILDQVTKLFDEVPDLPPVESIKRINGWAWQITSLKSGVYVRSDRWETRVLEPLSGQDLPPRERELLDQIHTELDKADADLRALMEGFRIQLDRAHPELRRALYQEPVTPDQLLGSVVTSADAEHALQPGRGAE